MKIALVAWGYVPKPPISNSVYTLINEYKYFLEKMGHQVDILNEVDPYLSIEYINNGNYDFVHLHAYNFVAAFNQKLNQKYCFTCHEGYLLKEDRWFAEFKEAFQSYIDVPGIIAHSHLTKEFFLEKGYSGYIGIQPNGINTQKINFTAQGNGRSICLGWIQPRKQQTLLTQFVDGKLPLDFAGPLDDPNFVEGKTTKYLGIWSLEQVYANLTNYSCLVLISDGESAVPLVVLEAMAAGLSVVISESASTNLETKEFITILPDNILTNPSQENQEIICNAITTMIKNNSSYRQEIREYIKDKFDFNQIIYNYTQIIDEFIKIYN